MENENKEEKKGKKVIIIAIIVILLLIILTLAIVLPLVLRKKDDKTKEATITLTATKGSGDGSFEGQKWFSKVGEETLEHTSEEAMTIVAKSGETVYLGYSYTLTYQFQGGAYIENLTYNSSLLKVSYLLCAKGTNNTEQFDTAIAEADWQTWTEATPQTTDNFLILKIEIQKLTQNETLPIDATLAVVDGEYLGKPLSITWTRDGYGYGDCIDINLRFVKLGDDGESQKTQNQNSPANLYLKEGETVYVGFCIGEGSGYHFFLDNPTASADLTVSDYVFFKSDDRGVTGGVAPTLDHFNDVLKGDVSWKPCQDHDVLTEEVKYFLLIFKIVAKDEFTAEDLSFSFNIWVQPAPE